VFSKLKAMELGKRAMQSKAKETKKDRSKLR